MRTSAATLVLSCLALAASPDRGAAQQGSCQPVIVEDSLSPDFAQGVQDCGNCRGNDPRVWGSAEFLLGFRKSRQVPPLVTTSPTGTVLAEAGVLGLPATRILFGGGGLEDNPQPGVRGEIGLWLDNTARVGVGGSFTGLQDDTVRFSASSDGSTILARPFFNTLIDLPGSLAVGFPGRVRGAVNVQSENKVYTAEVFFRQQIGLWPGQPPVLFLADTLVMRGKALFSLPGTQVVTIQEHVMPGGAPLTRLDLVAGYQYSYIDDSLSIANHMVSLDPGFLAGIGTTLDTLDRFDARNDFHGATIGLRSVSLSGRWSLAMLGKVALGNMRQVVSIRGQNVIRVPGGATFASAGGLLAQPSNIGRFARDRFAVIPEARIALNYSLTRRLSVGVGYDFIYWNRVALAGDQVNGRVDVTQTLPDPSFTFREGDFFVHAVTFNVLWNH